jgi:hypothetical protein
VTTDTRPIGSTVGLDFALERAGLPPSHEVVGLVDVACASLGEGRDAVLDVSRAEYATETEGADVLVVLARERVALVALQKPGLFRRAEPVVMVVPFSDYRDVAEDDEFAGHSVFFLPREPNEPFLLAWADARERDRMFRAIFAAHAGRYERWGLQLDPGNFARDFDVYYGQLVAEAPVQGHLLREWLDERYGPFDLTNALGFAYEWRRSELFDAERGGSSERVMRVGHPQPWDATSPEARRVILERGEQLFDAGLLGPPYDERSFDPAEPLSSLDAGPARLCALVVMSLFASELGHPRGPEWTAAARAGLGSVPPTALPPQLQEASVAIRLR